jgi:hypothetical protein
MKTMYLHFNGCANRWELYEGTDNRATDQPRSFVRDRNGNVRTWGNPLEAIFFARRNDRYLRVEIAV